MKRVDVTRHLFWSYLNHGLTLIFPIVTTALLVKTLGISEYGFYIYWLSWILIADSIAAYGFRLNAAVRIASADGDEEGDLYSIVQSTKAVLISIILLGSLIVSLSLGKWHAFVFLGLAGTLLGNLLTSNWYLNGKQEFALLARSTFIQKSIFLSEIVAISTLGVTEGVYVLLAHGLAAVLAGFYAQMFITRRVRFNLEIITIKNTINEFKDGVDAFVSQLSVTIYTNINAILIGQVLGHESVGAYSLAEKIYKAFGTLSAPSGRVFMSIFAQKGKSSYKDMAVHPVRLLLTIGLVFLFVSVVVHIFAKSLIEFFLKEEIGAIDAITILKILSAGIFFFALASTSTYILSAMGKLNRVRKISMMAAGISMVSVYPILHWFGMVGLSVFSVLLMAMIGMVQSYLCIKK